MQRCLEMTAKRGLNYSDFMVSSFFLMAKLRRKPCRWRWVSNNTSRHVHIKKSHNFAVKKGRVAHILVPFMVGAICGLALADPNLDSNQEKNTYEIVTLTTISKMYFFFLQNGSEIGTSSVLEFGLN